MYDEQHFTHDAATIVFDEDAPGITVDDDESVSFDWDDVETVTIENPPHANAFDSKEFYKLPATVAKPIPQPYQFSDETVWLKKPREELKNAAWSLDNAPWTLGHPDSGMVKAVDDVRGFWKDPRYIDSLDDLDADLHVPTNDGGAKEHLEENADVSVGFYNRIARTDEYDGVVGGTDDDVTIEGYQTDMLFDHCASVKVGRCPSGAGCGIDAQEHGHFDSLDEEGFISGTLPTNINDEADSTDSDMQETTDQPSGIHVEDGTWFAVGPSEHTKDSTDHPGDSMFPVDSCSDVEDAWKLRNHAEDLSIERSTLESRIQRAAEAKDCSGMPWENQDSPTMDEIAESAERYSISGRCADCGDGEDENTEERNMEIEFDDLSTDAAIAKLTSQHEGAEERLDELREAEEAAEVAEEAADVLDKDTDELPDAVSLLTDRIEELEEQVDELREPQIREDAEAIAERTDRFGEDADGVIESIEETLDESEDLADAVSDKRELVEDLTESFDEQTANPGGDDEGSSFSTDDKYAKQPARWED